VTIIVTPYQDEHDPAWHALRVPNIGASEAAAVMGAHDFLTPFELWARKSGHLEAREQTDAMEAGQDLEPVVIKKLRRQMPQWTDIVQPRRYYCDPELRLGASPDLFVRRPGNAQGVVEIKTASPESWQKYWQGATGPEPPLGVAIQCLVQQMLTQTDWAGVACLVIGRGLTLHVMDVPASPELTERIRREVKAFWKMVDEGRPPPPDYGRDAEAIRRVWRQGDDVEIDLRGDNELPDLVARREAQAAIRGAADKELKAINAELLHKLGAAERARYANGIITAKTIHKAAHQVRETTYRDLRVRPDREHIV
jgi:predicted phage-related endonuclease